MHHGEIQQWDRAYDFYHKPAYRLVANFIREGVFLPGKMLDRQHVEIELGRLSGHIPHQCASERQLCREGNLMDVLICPDGIVHDAASPVQAKVMQKHSAAPIAIPAVGGF